MSYSSSFKLAFTSILLLFSLLSLIAANSTQASESLVIESLGNQGKSVAIFTSQYSHKIDLFSIVRDEYIFPSALLDQLYRSGASHFLVQGGCGSFNTETMSKYKIESALPIGQSGVQIQIFNDPDIKLEWDAAIETLSDMFKISRKLMKEEQHFDVNNQFHFAQDTTDTICSDNIEAILQYIPCNGKKGLFNMIDQTKLFRSESINISFAFKILKEQSIVQVTIQITSLLITSNLSSIYRSEVNIEACPVVQTSFIQSGENKVAPKLKKYQDNGIEKVVFKKLNDISIQPAQLRDNSNNINHLVTSQRFMKNNWYYQSDVVVHQIYNHSNSTIAVNSFEFIPYHFYCVFSQIQVSLSEQNSGHVIPKQQQLNEQKNEYKMVFNRDSKQNVIFNFTVEIPSQQHITISIPTIKMMKTFENYPHDPQRGHDIISAVVLYSFKDQPQQQAQKLNAANVDYSKGIIFSNNAVAMLPEPDFSMPFNIVTFVSVLIGYLFLQIFRLATEKIELEQHDANILSKLINLFKN